MKVRVSILALLLGTAAAPILAQAPQAANPAPVQTAGVNDFKPTSANQPGSEYPQVNSERRVRVRIVAPQAQTVLLDIGAVRYPLT